MRELTRPEGREAVERVHVSGTEEARTGSENQLVNWVKGLTVKCERWRVPLENWSACWGACWLPPAPGATMVLSVGSATEYCFKSDADGATDDAYETCIPKTWCYNSGTSFLVSLTLVGMLVPCDWSIRPLHSQINFNDLAS